MFVGYEIYLIRLVFLEDLCVDNNTEIKQRKNNNVSCAKMS